MTRPTDEELRNMIAAHEVRAAWARSVRISSDQANMARELLELRASKRCVDRVLEIINSHRGERATNDNLAYVALKIMHEFTGER